MAAYVKGGLWMVASACSVACAEASTHMLPENTKRSYVTLDPLPVQGQVSIRLIVAKPGHWMVTMNAARAIALAVWHRLYELSG
jgi:hypothetical protein